MPENEIVKTVNIPIDEYFDMRSKAESATWLMVELGEMRVHINGLEQRIYELERKMDNDRH